MRNMAKKKKKNRTRSSARMSLFNLSEVSGNTAACIRGKIRTEYMLTYLLSSVALDDKLFSRKAPF